MSKHVKSNADYPVTVTTSDGGCALVDPGATVEVPDDFADVRFAVVSPAAQVEPAPEPAPPVAEPAPEPAPVPVPEPSAAPAAPTQE